MCGSVQEAQLFSVEEELTLKEAHWLQEEARLQSTVTALEQELELEKEQHGKEVQQLLKQGFRFFLQVRKSRRGKREKKE